MFGIYTALSPIYGEQPHCIGAALPKYQTYSCKINHERSIRPSFYLNFCSLLDKEYESKIAFSTVRAGEPRNYSLQLTYSF